MKAVEKELNGENGRDTSSFLKGLDEVLSDVKHMNEMECSMKECWREMEKLLLYDSGIRKEDVDEVTEKREEMNEHNLRKD